MSNYYKTIQELEQSINPNNFILFSENEIVSYYVTRYHQEVALKEFKESITSIIKEIKQELAENGISPRRVEDAIRMYNRMDNIEPNNAENIIKLLMINIGIVNTTWVYEDNYDLIISSINQLIELKSKVKVFKSKQNKVLNQIVNSIKEDGIAFYLVQQRYTSLKNRLKLFYTECNGDIEKLNSSELRDVMVSLDLMEAKAFKAIIEEVK